MDKIILSDKDQFPNEEIIFSHIGKTRVFWEALFNYIHIDYPGFVEEWRYYNDGKSWLMKVTYKSKTVFWLTILKGLFKITFYFGDKAEPLIVQSTISDELKNQFIDGKRYGKIRALTLTMNNKKNIEFAKEIISIKLKIK